MPTSSRSVTTQLFGLAARQLDGFRRRPMWHLSRFGTIVVLALACRVCANAPAASERELPIPGIAAQCAQCHEDQTAAWAKTVHRRTVDAPQLADDREGCGGCHTGLAAHLEDPSATPADLKTLSRDQVGAMCLSCHKGGGQMMWGTTAHSRLPQACLSCHDPHGGEGRAMLRQSDPEVCSQCHPQQAAEMHLPSHHPVPEGKMECSDCHNSHGDINGSLAAESSSEMCYRCHAEKAGPFMYEHAPVTEDCTVCHKAHGAQNDRLLIVDEPMLCLQCHPGHHDGHRTPLVPLDTSEAGVAEAMTAIHGFYDKCTSCHPRIHGSDLPSGTDNGTFMPGRPASPLERTSSTSPAGPWALAGLAALPLDAAGAAWGFSDFELGSIDEEGSPTYVREYDGKNYEFPRWKLGVDQYAEGSDYHLRLRDPAAGDEAAEIYFGSPTVSGDIKYDVLTHRLPRFDDVEGPVDYPGNSIETTDLSNGRRDFEIERNVTEINLAARCPKLRNVRWLGRYWRESEHGTQQFTFLDRCTSCHKVQLEEPIERVTTEASAGVEIASDAAAVRYMHTEGRFKNRAPELAYDFDEARGSVYSGLAPLFGMSETETSADEVRLMLVPGSAVALSGLWSNKERDNLFNGYGLEVQTTGGGAGWRIAPDLKLTASFFNYEFDNGVSDGISRDRDTSNLVLRYTALPYSTLSVGFRRDDVDRSSHHDFVPRNSETTALSANLVTRHPSGASLNIRYRDASTDVEGNYDPAAAPAHFPARWITEPDDEELLSAVASYGLTSRLLGTLLYSKLDRAWTVNEPLLSVLRSDNDEITTKGAELYYSIDGRTRLTAGIYDQEGSMRSDVTYGADIYTLEDDLGNPIADFDFIDSHAAFDYNAQTVRLDASHWLTPRLRLFGRFNRTQSDGATVASNLGDYLDQDPDLDGVALTLNPFDITTKDKWFGVGYLVDPYTELVLSFQQREWVNEDNASQDGSYDLWRIGVRKKF
ncbi:MAG: DmsE family decaheme c-type cytochrome [Armatimonadota bacterium]|nr:MAG: DmsE family decaheme c-type cytochrome [Armatimonadota bacterium]